MPKTVKILLKFGFIKFLLLLIIYKKKMFYTVITIRLFVRENFVGKYSYVGNFDLKRKFYKIFVSSLEQKFFCGKIRSVRLKLTKPRSNVVFARFSQLRLEMKNLKKFRLSVISNICFVLFVFSMLVLLLVLKSIFSETSFCLFADFSRRIILFN